jgi:RND family efflux transporter MFP subunit
MMSIRPYVIALSLAAAGCSGGGPSGAAHEAPATVEKPQKEADLTTVKLTQEAVDRLGLRTVKAATESAALTRTLGGAVVVPEGRGVVVTAPVAGTVMDASGAKPGARVRSGERLMTIAPLVPTERDQRIEAQRGVSSAEAEELAARQRLQRLEQLLKDGAASMRAVEEARAQHQVSVAALTAARDRLAGASRNPVGAEGDLVVSAPFDGVVQRVAAVQGQTVAASAALLEIAQVDSLWVRVPVYAGIVDDIDTGRPVSIRRLGASSAPIRATRVAAPLTGDPAAASVDLFFALEGASASLRPGERVLVELPLEKNERALVVPSSAVLYDVHGDAWVYEDLGGRAYARRRIQVARYAGDRAIVTRGLAEGTPVVTDGAAELFGTEFGAGH